MLLRRGLGGPCALLLGILLAMAFARAEDLDLDKMDADGDGHISSQEFQNYDASEEEIKGGQKKAASQEEAAQGDGPGIDPEEMKAMLEEAQKQIDAAVKKGVPIPLNQFNIQGILDGKANVLMKFSTSWCGHCVKMQPDWERLAKTVHKDYKGCRIVSVDCEESKEVCQAFGVEGYPTIIFFKLTTTAEGEQAYQPVPYKEARDFPSMLKFVRSQKGAKAKNPVIAAIKGFVSQVFKIEVSMPK